MSSARYACCRKNTHYQAAASAVLTCLPDSLSCSAQVNAEENKALGQKFGVQGFPTLKWIVGGSDGSVVDYKGGRSA